MSVQTHFFGDDCVPAHEAKAVLTRSMSEESLLEAVTDALTLYGYRWVHFRRSDKAQMMGHAGFPDIVASRKGRTLYLELKSDKGRLTPEQALWAQFLFPHWQIIRPADLDWLLEKLR